MVGFFRKVIVLLLPFGLLLIFPITVQILSGEFLSPDVVIQKEFIEKKNVLYGPVYGDQTLYFKSEMAKRVAPEVLALGNSKILTMRSQFFNNGVTFYNAGGVTPDIARFRNFLEVTGIKPSIIIITVEPLHFDPLTVVSTSTLPRSYEQVSFLRRLGEAVSRSWITVYGDYFQQKFTLLDLFHRDRKEEAIGLNALVNKNGFRNDGSLHYGKSYQNDLVKQVKVDKAITFIDTKTNVQSKTFFGEPALLELEDFLEYCKERNITVIGYIPPTPKVIEDAYKRHTKYDYMFHTYEKTSPIFKKYNFELYDFFSLAALGARDDEAIDEYHTNEKVMLRVMVKMSGKGTALSKVTSQAHLQKLLEAVKDGNDVLK